MSVPPLDLVLPEPLELNENQVIFSADVYPIILSIYNAYILWTETYIDESELEALGSLRLELCAQRLDLKDQTIELLKTDREYVYDLFNQELDDREQDKATGTIKLVLVSGATAIVGVAIGLIIGILAI